MAAARRGKEYATKHLALLPDQKKTAQCIAMLVNPYGPVKNDQDQWEVYKGETLTELSTMGANLWWEELEPDMTPGTYWLEGIIVVPQNQSKFSSIPQQPAIKQSYVDGTSINIKKQWTGVKTQCFYKGVTRVIKSCHDRIKDTLIEIGVNSSRATELLREARIATIYHDDMIKPEAGANIILLQVTPKVKGARIGDNWKMVTILPGAVKGPVIGSVADEADTVYDAWERVKDKCKTMLQTAHNTFQEYPRQASLTFTAWVMESYTRYPSAPNVTKTDIMQWVAGITKVKRKERAAKPDTTQTNSLWPAKADLSSYFRTEETILEELGAGLHTYNGKTAAGNAGHTGMALLRLDSTHQLFLAQTAALIKYETNLVAFETGLEDDQQTKAKARELLWDANSNLCITDGPSQVWCNDKRYPAYIIENNGVPKVRIILKRLVDEEYFQIRCLPKLTEEGERILFKYNGQVARVEGNYLANAENKFLQKCLGETQTHTCKAHYRSYSGAEESDPPEFSQMIGLPINDNQVMVVSTGADRRVRTTTEGEEVLLIGSQPVMLQVDQFPIWVEGIRINLQTFSDAWEVSIHPLKYIQQFPLPDWPNIVGQTVERHGWTWLYELLKLREDETADYTVTIIAVMTGILGMPALSIILCLLVCRYNACCRDTTQDMKICLANLCGRLQRCCGHTTEPSAPPLYQDEPKEERQPLAPSKLIVSANGSRYELLPLPMVGPRVGTRGNTGLTDIVTVADTYPTIQHERTRESGASYRPA